MTTHDTLAYAVAGEAVRQIRGNDPVWTAVFSANVYATASRTWPMPDFVIADSGNSQALAGEFKPPDQTKREYLTGLGQAIAYTRDFHYAALVLPKVANDGYAIAEHVKTVLEQTCYNEVPISLWSYDPNALSTKVPTFHIERGLTPRTHTLRQAISFDSSFYAKWREISQYEMDSFLNYLYEEGRAKSSVGTIRDRAFDRLWTDMVNGRARNFSGQVRRISNTQKNRTGQFKNYRNFVEHVGWCLPDGKLTESGLEALRVLHLYGPDSAVFKDRLTSVVLNEGKHLVLLNAINEVQDRHLSTQGPFQSSEQHLDFIEESLEDLGLLKRNPGRAAAAVQNQERGFLKSEKQLWRELELIVPHGRFTYHPQRGFIFDWRRISALLSTA